MTPHELEWMADVIAERVAAKMAGIDPDPMGDVHQAAQWLGVSVATVERLTRSGAIPSHKFGRLRRYRRSDLTGNKEGGAA
jgi:excisionase family DNA binding protein